MLRKGLLEYLKQHPNVKKTEMAPLNEGGFGATFVYVKKKEPTGSYRSLMEKLLAFYIY